MKIETVMKMALLAEEKNDKAAMKVYYSYILIHLANKLRDIGEDGDQADQLAYVLSGGR